METLAASLPRFPVSRETLNSFRTAGGQIDAGHVERGEGGVHGERQTNQGAGAGQQETTGQGPVSRGDVEDKAKKGRATETRTKEPSHDPGGSWLTKKTPEISLYLPCRSSVFLPVPPWSHPEFPEFPDLGDKRKKNDRVRR
ncbi:hypothetical protein NDU88_006164 [Pleurodeles waltl]|uniref:Uncharacterized protein n=1 Tax=Pleurodeles waltl TaxID=8319 RepID=A0AAV7RR33_PLEWA|nr:hypothetical protein NDU88_006164 [Pleurodeles waltl]